MNALVYDTFRGPVELRNVPAPAPPEGGALIRVMATGLCRSDWHGWMGHDPGIALPHVPGHELAGVVEAVGRGVRLWKAGDRITVPFACGCGHCPPCLQGDAQVCDLQSQPGFTRWGSFAEFVAVDYADGNLVRLPESLDFETAALLGCRFATSFRALAHVGRLQPGEWVAVHGCGGVGLSAILIARALGARVAAVDLRPEALDRAQALGAEAVVDAAREKDVAQALRDATGGGAHVSMDALGHPDTCYQSVACLRKRGRHVQVGLLLAEQSRPRLPMDRVIADELEILGSHGMPARSYPAMLELIQTGRLDPGKLIGRRISLAEAAQALPAMDANPGPGVTVIDRF